MGGKVKKGGRGGNKYVHNHTYNPVARESDERKIERLHSMEVKRYQNYVDRNMKVVTQYLPLDTIAYKKKKVGKRSNDLLEVNTEITRLATHTFHSSYSILSVVHCMSLDPMFHLKGAARPAQEFYRPPGNFDGEGCHI